LLKNIPDVFFSFVLEAAALLAALLASVILKILARHDLRVLASIQMHRVHCAPWISHLCRLAATSITLGMHRKEKGAQGAFLCL
jgi:hypothetical protein